MFEWLPEEETPLVVDDGIELPQVIIMNHGDGDHPPAAAGADPELHGGLHDQLLHRQLHLPRGGLQVQAEARVGAPDIYALFILFSIHYILYCPSTYINIDAGTSCSTRTSPPV